MLHSAQEVYNYSGIYISYSLSSSSNALKVEALPDNPCRQQRPRQSGAYERLQHHPLRHCCLQQPPECLYLLQRTRGTPTGLVHHLPATAHVRLSPPAQRALPLPGLQPQPHSPPHPLHQTLGQHLHGRLPGTERPAHPQDQLTDEQRPYYNYTCQPGDFIKTCSVPSPLLNEKDLEREKRMLEI